MNIKKILALVLAVMIICTLFACGNDENKPSPEPEATITPLPEPTALPTLEPQPDITDPGELVEYTVSRTISSNMVVQRNAYFNVFGCLKTKAV